MLVCTMSQPVTSMVEYFSCLFVFLVSPISCILHSCNVLVSGSVDLVLPWKKASSISLLPTALSGYTVVPALSSRLMVNSSGHLVSTGQLQASDAGTYQIRSSDFVGVLSISIMINSEHHSIAAV